MTTKRLPTSTMLFERSMKKPKLDINVNKTRLNETVLQDQRKLENFWDDDDDDVILLASQMADTAAAIQTGTAAATSLSKKNSIKEKPIDNTFMEFHAFASTSTQKPIELPNRKILTQLLDDDEGDCELLAVLEKEDPIKKQCMPLSKLDGKVTESHKTNKINDNQTKIGIEFTEFILSENSVPVSAMPPSSTQNVLSRRQLASERQMKFLMDKVTALKKENANLHKSLLDNKTKMQEKAGECTMLRDELRHMQQELKNNQMAKILNAETAKNECQTKIMELSKQIVATETKLRLQQVECSKVKTKYAEETQKFQQSMLLQDTSMQEDDNNNATATTSRAQQKFHSSCHTKNSKHYNKWLLKMRHLDISSNYNANNNMPLVPANFYESSEECGGSTKQNTIFELELRNVQQMMTQLQLILKGTDEEAHVALLPKCVDSSSKMFAEFWSYCYSLEHSKKCRSFPYHNINNIYTNDIKQDVKAKRLSILLKSLKLFDKEKGISLRRYISALTIMCQKMPNLSVSLLESKQNDYYLLQIISDAIKKLSYARDNAKHFGILEAIARFLHIIILQVSIDLKPLHIKMIVELLKQIIFAQPSNWVLLEVSSIFLACIKRVPQILNYLCVNSREITYINDRATLSNRFTNDSCTLQVYSGQLGIAFPTISKLDIDQYDILIELCLNHIRFGYDCFTRPAKFIQKNLQFFNITDDEDKSTDDISTNPVTNAVTAKVNGNSLTCETSTGTFGNTNPPKEYNNNTNDDNDNDNDNDAQITCKCYIQFCRSFVTLIFQTLRQWILHEKKIYTFRVSKISRLSIHLMHLIFCENHSIYLLRDFEEISKHQLQFICQWLNHHKNIFEFNEINANFLRDLQNSHIMPKYVSMRSNLRNIVDDLLVWSEQVKFDEKVAKLGSFTEDEAKIHANNLIFGDDIENFKIL